MAFDRTDSEFPFLTCDSCGRGFQTYGDGARQASGCAAEVDLTALEIQGYYGSTVADCTVFRIEEIPHWLSRGDICDNCIVRLLELGYITEQGQTYK